MGYRVLRFEMHSPGSGKFWVAGEVLRGRESGYRGGLVERNFFEVLEDEMKKTGRIGFGVMLGGLVVLTAALLVSLIVVEARAGERDLFGGLPTWALILLGIAFALPCFLGDFLAVKGAYLLTENDYETPSARIPDILSLAISAVQILAFTTFCTVHLIAPSALSLLAFKVFMAILWACAAITVTIEIERLND